MRPRALILRGARSAEPVLSLIVATEIVCLKVCYFKQKKMKVLPARCEITVTGCGQVPEGTHTTPNQLPGGRG